MYKYVKSDVNVNEVGKLGLLSMWDSSSGRRDILSEVKKAKTSDIINVLQDTLDDDEFRDIILMLASAVIR